MLQEILHRYISTRRPETGRQLIDYFISLVPNVLPVSKEDVVRAARLSLQYPGLPSRDLLHLAAMLNHGIPAILSADTHFDRVAEVRRMDPAEF